MIVSRKDYILHTDSMEIAFLAHSGFACREGKRVYVFDYWQDPAHHIDSYAEEGLELWFFVSHIHGDHYEPAIADFDGPHTKYILHKDVRQFAASEGSVYYMDVDDELLVNDVAIHMYGSTDAGGSFLLTTKERRIFHAGDLNWWHWLGDTEENNREARSFFERELQRMNGMEADVVFFPIDARLEGAREWGIHEWLQYCKVRKLLVPMHMHDLERGGWQPSAPFKAAYGHIPLWIPKSHGEKGTFHV